VNTRENDKQISEQILKPSLKLAQELYNYNYQGLRDYIVDKVVIPNDTTIGIKYNCQDFWRQITLEEATEAMEKYMLKNGYELRSSVRGIVDIYKKDYDYEFVDCYDFETGSKYLTVLMICEKYIQTGSL